KLPRQTEKDPTVGQNSAQRLSQLRKTSSLSSTLQRNCPSPLHSCLQMTDRTSTLQKFSLVYLYRYI
ncbi:hypothetical protein FQN60_008763, partial [Etheostoma spectabile]